MGEDIPCVVLDRVNSLLLPPYCIHGETRCRRCDHPVWLGDQTYKLVASGRAIPLCLTCANVAATMGVLGPHNRRAHVRDHRRSDGRHL